MSDVNLSLRFERGFSASGLFFMIALLFDKNSKKYACFAKLYQKITLAQSTRAQRWFGVDRCKRSLSLPAP